MQCEMCGTSKGELVQAIVEGSLLNVCRACSKFGAVIEQHPDESTEYPSGKSETPPLHYHYSEPAEHIHPEFPSIIRQAREKKKLSHEELATALAEKVSVLQKIESGSLHPQVKLCKKLEQFLQIKLILQQPLQPPPEKKQLDFRNQKLTIGDMLKWKQ